ncbi:MAG: molybdopterin dinucleotide binding domain-containing protein, partial [Luteococcus japonicus]
SPATAAQAGLVPGGSVIVQGPTGSLALPVVVEETMVDGVVWIPTNSSSASRRSIGAAVGSPVGLTAVSNNSDIAGGVA